MNQREKAEQFRRLHHSGKMLILPNIWDSLGAQLLENIGYPAIATASAAVAYSNGYPDGEQIPFEMLLAILKRIASSVSIPTTADIESGFADHDSQLENNIRLILETGVVAINFEDMDRKNNKLFPVEVQCNRIKLIRRISDEKGIPIFINARTDVLVRGNGGSPETKLDEAFKRGLAYKEAGADCFFPLSIQNEEDIRRMVETLQMPLNILLLPGVPELNDLQKMGVARVSLGPGFLKMAIKAMKTLAEKLQRHDGLSEITGNEITSAYLSDLVNRKAASR